MYKNNKKILGYLFSIVVIVFLIIPTGYALASTGGGDTPTPTGGGDTPTPTNPHPAAPIKIDNPFKQTTIESLINVVIKEILIPIGGVVSVVMIIYAGLLFVTARGNSAQITKARDALLYACIGAAILLGAFVISEAISGTITQLKS